MPFQPNSGCDLRRSCHSMLGVARLKDGVTIGGARAEIAGIASTLERQYPDSNRFGDRDLTRHSVREIVGVVDDIREGPLDAAVWPAVYYPFEQRPGAFFAVRAARCRMNAPSCRRSMRPFARSTRNSAHGPAA